MAKKQTDNPDISGTNDAKSDAELDASQVPSPQPEKAPLGWYDSIKANDFTALAVAVEADISQIVIRHKMTDYQVLFLFDERDSITNYHSDRLYAAVSANRAEKKDILLILHSNGGSIEPAYLVSKTLKRFAKDKFICAVPRRAKSAATLLALGSDQIHMGMISQLGPIDPQIGGLPALAIGNALEVVADLACRYPKSSDMLTKYLTNQVTIRSLGFYQRISESAEQYAERLFANRTLGGNRSPSDVAKYLVNHYKDHGFVIDFEEAQSLLGADIVRLGSAEYNFSDEIYRYLDLIRFFLAARDRYSWLVGGLNKESFGTRKIEDD